MTNLASSISSNKKFLIFGCGFSGNVFAQKIRELGCTALTSSRSKKNDPHSFVFNSETNIIPDEDIFDGVTHILSCIPLAIYQLLECMAIHLETGFQKKITLILFKNEVKSD